MPQMINYKSFNEFYNQNKSYFFKDTMKNHFLIHMSEEIFARRIVFYKAFNVVDGDTNLRVTVLHVDNFILLYSDGHSPEMIPLI